MLTTLYFSSLPWIAFSPSVSSCQCQGNHACFSGLYVDDDFPVNVMRSSSSFCPSLSNRVATGVTVVLFGVTRFLNVNGSGYSKFVPPFILSYSYSIHHDVASSPRRSAFAFPEDTNSGLVR